MQRPTLVIAHNKTLAAQLYGEFREFFPDNAVEYFVSYYDYYQPEAYVPQTDTYIEKDSSINEEIDQLRHSATASIFERRDVIIVATVSCIYGLGSPEDYRDMMLSLRQGMRIDRDSVLGKLVDIQYSATTIDFARGHVPGAGGRGGDLPGLLQERALRVEFFGDEIERILEIDTLTGEMLARRLHAVVFPASHYVTPRSEMERAIAGIEAELEERLRELRGEGKLLEAQRLEQRTRFDLEMMREVGYCKGIENYSRHLTGRKPGEPPYCLLDYFPEDLLVVIDESHVTIPQLNAMYDGDRSRKRTLVDYGFRLPSALDNRPLRFDEFVGRCPRCIFISATPGPYELSRRRQVVEQIIRPTGLMDPEVEVRPATGQVDDLVEEIRLRVEKRQRVLVTTLTKRMAEDLTDYLRDTGHQGALPALGHRHPGADGDPPRPAPGGIRRAGGDQPAAGGPRPAGGLPGGDPGRRQGGLPALGALADPDQRTGGPEHGRQGDHVCRHRHRLHAAGDRRDQPPPPHPDGLQPAPRDHAPLHPERGPGSAGDHPAGGGGERRGIHRQEYQESGETGPGKDDRQAGAGDASGGP